MATSLGSRAIARMQGGGSGFSDAKKIADLYVSTNTNDEGEVKDPAVYERVISQILAPYEGTIDGQNLIADYRNKMKKLTSAKNDADTTLSALRQKEYSAWYVDEDNESADGSSSGFRNPAWVAQVTSESLDMILAETLDLREKKAADNKDVSTLDSYIAELTRRSDRMRSIATQLEDGVDANLDGYGYYVDSDPNTGAIRGASFMPTDVNFSELSKGTIRTDSMVTVGNKKVPVYLPYIKQEDGTNIARFGGTEYTGDTNLLSGGEPDVAFTDKSRYQGGGSGVEMNKIYQTFTGKTNVDGSYKKDYLYVSPDNKIYRFGEDDPKGKELIESMRSISGMKDIPRLSPVDVNKFYVEPLPTNSSQITQSAVRSAKIDKYTQEAAVYEAEATRLENQSELGKVIENAPGVIGRGISAVSSFFSRKNRVNTPDKTSTSINGQSSGKDVVDSGSGFFRNRTVV